MLGPGDRCSLWTSSAWQVLLPWVGNVPAISQPAPATTSHVRVSSYIAVFVAFVAADFSIDINKEACLLWLCRRVRVVDVTTVICHSSPHPPFPFLLSLLLFPLDAPPTSLHPVLLHTVLYPLPVVEHGAAAVLEAGVQGRARDCPQLQ